MDCSGIFYHTSMEVIPSSFESEHDLIDAETVCRLLSPNGSSSDKARLRLRWSKLRLCCWPLRMELL
jgi:hypothetical protein